MTLGDIVSCANKSKPLTGFRRPETSIRTFRRVLLRQVGTADAASDACETWATHQRERRQAIKNNRQRA